MTQGGLTQCTDYIANDLNEIKYFFFPVFVVTKMNSSRALWLTITPPHFSFWGNFNVTGPPGALLFDRDQISHWNNHCNCCFVRVAALGIYCTDFLPQILIQVKYPMQSVGHHIWWKTEHIFNIFETVATFCCQILTALSEEICLHWATMHWVTGIKNNERICHLAGNDTSHY